MKKALATLLLIVVVLSQLNYRAFADTVNLAAIHNNVHEALSGFNTTVVNPAAEINTILNSVVSPHLDLTSILHSIDVGHLTNEVGINVGGHSLEINSNQLVTPAEALALAQVLSIGHQSLDLSTLGNAVAGSLNASLLGNNIDNLVLPNLVTLIDNSHSLLLNGNLVNYGDIQFMGNASLTANNVYNTSSGEIQGNSNLTINTNQSLINEGTIAANNNLVLNTPIIFNAGAIESLNGNLNIVSLTNLDITGNQNGNFEALKGDINIVESNLNINNGINLASGNYLSQELNISASSGYVQGVTGNVTGQINTNADTIHLATASKDMWLGNNHILGDPTYVNTANGGAIFIDGTITTNGNNIAIIADGAINIASSSNSSINTSGATNSGSLIMIAGVGSNISYTGSNTTTGVPLPGTPIASGESFTVSLGMSSGNYGGNIDLVTNNTFTGPAVINTAATNGNAGNVTLVAIANSSGSGGQVLLSNGTNVYGIDANGSNNGGEVTIIATAPGNVNGIEVGGINTAGSVTPGTIGLYCAIPFTSGPTFDSNGNLTIGIIYPSSTLTNSNIQIDSNLTGSSTITINTGGNIDVGNHSLSGNLNIIANSGSFTNSATPLVGNISGLSVNLQNSNFYMQDSGSSLSLNTSSLANNYILSITMLGTNESITVTSTITAGSNSSQGTIDLTASGTGNITANGGIYQANLQAKTIDLITGTGNFGSSINSTLPVITAYLSLYTQGSSFITDSEPVSISASTVSSQGTYYLADPSGQISINGLISAGTDAQSGSIILSGGSGIGMTSGLLTANNISLTSSSANNIGSQLNPITIDSPNITIASPSASAYISDLVSSSVSISNANISISSTGTFYLSMFNNAPISIDGNFTIGSDNGSSSLTLVTTGSITTTSNSYVVTAGNIDIYTSSIGNSTNAFLIDTANLTSVTRTGSAYFSDKASSLNINSANSANVFTVYMITNNGSINIAGNLTTVNDSTGSVNLVPGAYGTITSSNSTLIITGNLQLFSTYGNIGSNSQGLLIDSTNLTVTSQASAFVSDSAANVNLNNSSVGSVDTLSLSMTSAGSIVVNGNVTAGADTGTGVISLSTSGTGSITTAASTYVLTAGAVNLVTSGGNIGSNIQSLLTDSQNLTINSQASAYISDSATSVNLNAISVGSAGSFNLNMTNATSGSIVINGNVTAGTDAGTGTIILNAKDGTITTAASNDVLTAGTVSLYIYPVSGVSGNRL